MGAFLARNFGGAALIHDVATNSAPGSYESWDVALAECSSNTTEHSTLSGALSEFPIALIASSCEEAESTQDRPHKYSFFNRKDSSIRGKNYIFEPFPAFQKPAKRFSLPYTGYMYPYDFDIQELGVVTETSNITINNVNESVTYRLVFRDKNGKMYANTRIQ